VQARAPTPSLPRPRAGPAVTTTGMWEKPALDSCCGYAMRGLCCAGKAWAMHAQRA